MTVHEHIVEIDRILLLRVRGGAFPKYPTGICATNGLWPFPFIEHVFAFEALSKAYEFQVLQQHPGIIFGLESF